MAFSFSARDPLRSAQELRDLADDLERLTMFRPGDDVLEGAPLLNDWVRSGRILPALAGRVEGHPLLPNGPVLTSELHALDKEGGWARTASRFYRLGDELKKRRRTD